MTDQSVPEDSLDDGYPSKPPLAWEVPEIFGAAVLSSVSALAVGCLATGIARAITEAASNFPPGLGSQEVWNAIQFGSEWAGPLLAIVVLGVLGLCWWQVDAWLEVAETRSDDDDDESEARGHMHRAHLIARWAMVALVVTAAGSIAGFVAEVGTNAGRSFWTLDLYGGGSLLAVLVLLSAAVPVNRKIQHSDVSSTVAVQRPA
jgi:hypothetical protein